MWKRSCKSLVLEVLVVVDEDKIRDVFVGSFGKIYGVF